jgi:hypothetical protein
MPVIKFTKPGKTGEFSDDIGLSCYVGVLIKYLAFPIFLFAAQRKEFFLDGLNKLEQRSHKCVELRGGGYVE